MMDGKMSVRGNNAMFLLDPTKVNTAIIEWNKERMEYHKQFELASSTHIVQPFTAFYTPANPKLAISLLTGTSLGLFSFVVIVGMMSMKKLYAQELNSRKAYILVSDNK